MGLVSLTYRKYHVGLILLDCTGVINRVGRFANTLAFSCENSLVDPEATRVDSDYTAVGRNFVAH